MHTNRNLSESWEIVNPQNGFPLNRTLWQPGIVDISEHKVFDQIEPCVVYQVPEEYESGLPMRLDPPESIGEQLLAAYWELASPKNPGDLLPDFVRLADGESADVIARFANQWGPLWICHTHWIPRKKFCLWTPYQWPAVRKNYRTDCLWLHKEPVSIWQEEAARARAALTIFGNLSKDRISPLGDWNALGSRFLPAGFITELREQNAAANEAEWHGPIYHTPAGLQYACSMAVNKALAFFGGPTIALNWTEPDQQHGWKNAHRQPMLAIDPGFGFLGLVWLQIAEFVTDAERFCVCSSCDKVYPRFKRKPRENWHNYCPECAKTGKGPKAAWRAKAKEK